MLYDLSKVTFENIRIDPNVSLRWGTDVCTDPETGLVYAGPQSEVSRKFQAGLKQSGLMGMKSAEEIQEIVSNNFLRNRLAGKDTEITIDGKPYLTFHADGSVTNHKRDFE